MWYYVRRTINGDPGGAVEYATRAWVDLVDKGHASGLWLPFKPTDSAWIAKNTDDNIVGILVYSCHSAESKIVIELAHVHRDVRHNGIYNTMLTHLKNDLRDGPYDTIESNIHPDNKAMLDIAKKQNRSNVWTTRMSIK